MTMMLMISETEDTMMECARKTHKNKYTFMLRDSKDKYQFKS